MKVLILRTTVAEKRFVSAGSVVDLSDAEARALILLGKAIEAVDVPEVKVEPLTTENAGAVVATETKRKGRRRAG